MTQDRISMDFIHTGKQDVGLKSSSDIMENDTACGFAAISKPALSLILMVQHPFKHNPFFHQANYAFLDFSYRH